jgi:hypothetical protein
MNKERPTRNFTIVRRVVMSLEMSRGDNSGFERLVVDKRIELDLKGRLLVYSVGSHGIFTCEQVEDLIKWLPEILPQMRKARREYLQELSEIVEREKIVLGEK